MFGSVRSLRLVAFEEPSELVRIEIFAFWHWGSLQTFCIPSFVADIESSVFLDSDLQEVQVCEANRHFGISGDCLVSSQGRVLVQYFGRDSNVRIDREIEAICNGGFQILAECSSLEFESESQLRRVDGWAFSGCSSLRSICIRSLGNPRMDQHLPIVGFGRSGLQRIIAMSEYREISCYLQVSTASR
jgi:hypothetical protein